MPLRKVTEWEAKKPYDVEFVRMHMEEGDVYKVVGYAKMQDDQSMCPTLLWGGEGDCWNIMQPMSQGSPRLTNVTKAELDDTLADHPQTFFVRNYKYDMHWE